MHKKEILKAIRCTAKENGGKPLGKVRFEKITGIREYDWQKFWPRFSEAQQEAGFVPDQFSTNAYNHDFLIKSIIELIRELKKFPTVAEMRIKRGNDPAFPNDSIFIRRFGNKAGIILQVHDYCIDKEELSDIIEILKSMPIVKSNDVINTINSKSKNYGFVYLMKGHPGEYKIGRTNLVDRRMSELGTKTSIKPELIHEIKTDDPVGVEAYWHKRFQRKKMRGEWFKLSSAEVKSFKKWRRIY